MDGTEFAKELLARPNAFDPYRSFIVSGIAATVDFECRGVRLDPSRAQCQLPIPLLRQHNWNHPLGSVLRTKADAGCLWFEARVANAAWAWARDGWEEIKNGQLPAVSLAPINLSGDFDRWAIREISICDEAQNQDAIVCRVVEIYKPYVIRMGRATQTDVTVHREIGPAFDFAVHAPPCYIRRR